MTLVNVSIRHIYFYFNENMTLVMCRNVLLQFFNVGFYFSDTSNCLLR